MLLEEFVKQSDIPLDYFAVFLESKGIPIRRGESGVEFDCDSPTRLLMDYKKMESRN